jgi:hypothetical protein
MQNPFLPNHLLHFNISHNNIRQLPELPQNLETLIAKIVDYNNYMYYQIH